MNGPDPGGLRLGIGQVFAPGESLVRMRTELDALGVTDLRLEIPPTWTAPEARRALDEVFATFARGGRLLPSLAGDTPCEQLRVFVDAYGAGCEWVELRAMPTRPFAEAGRAIAALRTLARELRERGKYVALSGTPERLHELLYRGELEGGFDAFAVSGASQGERGWTEWARGLHAHGGGEAELWVCGLGLAQRERQPRRQLHDLVQAASAPVARLYLDLHHADESGDGTRAGKGRTLVARLLGSGGFSAASELLQRAGAPRRAPGYTVITGGAGFVGCNLADRLLGEGEPVLIYDNLSRPGTEENLRWLCDKHGAKVGFELADMRDRQALGRALHGAGRVFHFAAQVAVTTSLDVPVFDHEVNAAGTLFLLEALRALDRPVPLVFTSTNKVYGGLEDVGLQATASRYQPIESSVRAHGIGESRPLQFSSPYGCSKGVADQYVLDYAHTFGLPATVLRMSCIYGPHQFGNEDQGWVAHFVRQALAGQPITIYGDGLQVRDVLYVDDLVDAMLLAAANLPRIAGRAFNIGGGPQNILSLQELMTLIARLRGAAPHSEFDDWRPSDQRWYVSDIRAFAEATGWAPRVGVEQGVSRLIAWLEENRPELGRTAPRAAVANIAQAEVGS